MNLPELIATVVATVLVAGVVLWKAVKAQEKRANAEEERAWHHDDSYLDAGEHPQFKREDKDD